MAKTITLHYDGEDYTLEYTREAAKAAEAQGLVLGEISEKPATMIPILFRCAFYANHRKIKAGTTDKIFASLPDKTEFIGALGEMYAETIESLFDTENESEKKSEWKKTW